MPRHSLNAHLRTSMQHSRRITPVASDQHAHPIKQVVVIPYFCGVYEVSKLNDSHIVLPATPAP